MPTVIEILKQHLVDNGFDGLVTDDYECGCGIDDLRPCDADFAKCLAAYKDTTSGRFVLSKDKFVIAENCEQGL